MKKKEILKLLKNKTFLVFNFSTIIFVLFLTIGFSSFLKNLSITNANMVVRTQEDIRVTNVSVSNTTNSAISEWEEYNVHNITSSLTLPNSNSTATYQIEITNIGNTIEGIFSIDEIYKIAGSNNDSNLEIKNINYTLKDPICDDDNSSQCSLGIVKTINVTIGYKANGYDANNINHNIMLDFDFRRIYNITYIGFNNLTGLPTNIIAGDSKTITFNSTTGIPTSVTVSGATSNYVSPTLTLSNPDNNVSIEGTFGGGGSGTPDDPYVNNEVTEYDHTEVDPGTTVVFPNVPGVPVATKDEDGDIIHFEYTNISSDDPVVLENGHAIDTGIIGLNGEKFTFHIVFRAALENNNNKFIVSAIEQTGNTFSGLSLYDYNSGYVRVGVYRQRARGTTTNLLTPNTYTTGNTTAITGMKTFDVTVVYDPKGYQDQYAQVNLSMTVDGTTKTGVIRNSAVTTNIPQTLNSATITLGGNGLDSTDNMVYFEVIEFEVTKG